MITLTEEQILILHSKLIRMTGGSDGIRKRELLLASVCNNSIFEEKEKSVKSQKSS